MPSSVNSASKASEPLPSTTESPPEKPGARKQDRKNGTPSISKRRCIGSACIACKRRKSKCDGALPACAACTAVYGTPCEYDLNSDHRRKGVYKKDAGTKPKADTLQTIIEALLNFPEDEAVELVKRLRACENLESVATEIRSELTKVEDESPAEELPILDPSSAHIQLELAAQIGHMRLDDGTIHFVGGTSNLRFGEHHDSGRDLAVQDHGYTQNEDIIRSWTTVTTDVPLILHLLQLYFTWHYPSFVTLPKLLFFQDFFKGRPSTPTGGPEYCTPLLVNAMLALGCHFTTWPRARSDPMDNATAGEHFFREAKRLILGNEEFEHPKIATVQALALMSVREAGCGREAKGWVYSGMSFRMACDLGLNIEITKDRRTPDLTDEDIDARRITFWGCYQVDKCWSNYLGRAPQLSKTIISASKFDVFPGEDSDSWSPRNDNGIDKSTSQPARTRAVALQMSTLCEISEDLLATFYSPTQPDKPLSKVAEVKRLSDFHTRLEAWLKDLPKEMEAKEGQLPYVLVMHMFFQLLYIHLFRPFLKYTRSASPLPPDVSPRKLCTQAALKISKLLRLYKKTYGLKQICNIVVYIAHSACSIHLLNLPDKDARRDIGYGVRHLEEIGEFWPCAIRTLATLAVQVRRWRIELPQDTSAILDRWEIKYKHERDTNRSGPVTPSAASSPAATIPQGDDFLMQIPATGQQVNGNNSISNPDNKTQTGPLLFRQHYQQQMQFQQQGFGSLPQSQSKSQHKQPLHSLHRPALRSTKSKPSGANLYGGIDALFEENRDWVYNDQTAFYENWSRRESAVGLDRNSGPILDSSPAGSGNLMDIDPKLNALNTWDFDEDIYDFGTDNGQHSMEPSYSTVSMMG